MEDQMNKRQAWDIDARAHVRNIKESLKNNGRYVYGRLANGHWIRIVNAKSQKGSILGQVVRSSGLCWEKINQWDER
jgi:hypothetical protein